MNFNGAYIKLPDLDEPTETVNLSCFDLAVSASGFGDGGAGAVYIVGITSSGNGLSFFEPERWTQGMIGGDEEPSFRA